MKFFPPVFQKHLIISQKFEPGDSGVPYIKTSLDQRNGWGSLAGFMERSKVPASMLIEQVDPAYTPTPITPEFLMELQRVGGARIARTPDGFTAEKGSLDPKESFRRSQELWLADERAEEELARPKSDESGQHS